MDKNDFQEDIKKRFSLIYSDLKGSGKIKNNKDLADKIGYSPQKLNEILKGRTKFNLDFLQIFCTTFDYSLDFLVFGKRLKKTIDSPSTIPYTQASFRTKGTTETAPITEIQLQEGKPNTVIVDAIASTNFDSFLNNPKKLEELPSISLLCAPFGLNIAFQVNGDSMHNTIRHSDYVAANKINNINNIRDGHVYIIVDKEEGVLCKRLYRQGTDFKIVSDNPNYSPYLRSHHYILALFKAFCRFSFDFRPYNEYFQVAINKLKSDMEQVKKQLNMP